MADSTVPGADPELRIEIWPRGYDWWHGTSAQLQAEGVIPPHFEWPKGKEHKSWVSGHFEYWLTRERPEGHRGPQSSWLEIDNWSCRRRLAAKGRDGFAAARLYEKQVALAREIWGQTREARQEWTRYVRAQNDSAFQAILATVVPQPKRRGKAARAE